MTFVERIATYLDLVGIPTGRLCPGNLIGEVCGSFVKADELARLGVDVPGRRWSLEDLRVAAEDYVGLDLVSEVLDVEIHPGQPLKDHAIGLAQRIVKCAESHPNFFKSSISKIVTDIQEAQRRLKS